MQTNSDSNARLSLLHIEALQKRGLTNATIDAAGFLSLSAEQVLTILKFNLNRSGGLGIPFIHPTTEETRLIRVRPDVAPIIDGKPAKYLSPKGAGNLLYCPPGCADRINDPTEPLYITEGEFKALAAWQAGLLAVGTVGVNGWKGKGLNGHGQPIPDLDLIVWRERTIIIVFDSDAAINPEVQRARQALAREAYRRGARTVYTINLPAPDGVKVGWDDYLQAHGRESFLDLDAEEIPSPYPQVKVWTLTELRATNLERPAPIVPGWGIRQAGKVIITGAGGRGKSTLLLQLICNFVADRPLLGHPQLAVHGGPHRVMLYMAEDPLSEVRFRLLRQIEELEYGPEVETAIHLLEFGDRKPPLLTDEWALQVLADRIRQHRATIAVLDPLVTLHDRDENSNPQMRAVLDAVSPIAEETGCTFILAHHEPKSPENNGAASRGASAIRDWCRTMLRLTSHGEDEDRVRRYSLVLDKANYGGSVWNLTLEREEDHYTFRLAEEMETVTPMQVWETIGPEERWFTDVLKEIMQTYNVSETTAARAVKKAEKLFLAVIGEKTNPNTGRMKKTLSRGKGEGTADGE
jgi:RecA-family ATPase